MKKVRRVVASTFSVILIDFPMPKQELNIQEIIAVTEQIRAKGLAAMVEKNLDAYMSIFADRLTYIQANGKAITKARLRKDQNKYFSRIKSIENESKRISCKLENGVYSETFTQKSRIGIRIFIFFTTYWRVERKGLFQWEQVEGQWKIVQVKVLEEDLSPKLPGMRKKS